LMCYKITFCFKWDFAYATSKHSVCVRWFNRLSTFRFLWNFSVFFPTEIRLNQPRVFTVTKTIVWYMAKTHSAVELGIYMAVRCVLQCTGLNRKREWDLTVFLLFKIIKLAESHFYCLKNNNGEMCLYSWYWCGILYCKVGEKCTIDNF
jgi:hypothetical protein